MNEGMDELVPKANWAVQESSDQTRSSVYGIRRPVVNAV